MSLFSKLFNFKRKKNETALTKTANFNGTEVIIKAPITQVREAKGIGYYYTEPTLKSAKKLSKHYSKNEDNPHLSKPVKPSGFKKLEKGLSFKWVQEEK